MILFWVNLKAWKIKKMTQRQAKLYIYLHKSYPETDEVFLCVRKNKEKGR